MEAPLKQFKDALGNPIGRVGHSSRFPEEVVQEARVDVEERPFFVTQFRTCGHEHLLLQLPTFDLAMALARKLVSITNEHLDGRPNPNFIIQEVGQGEGDISLTDLIESLEQAMFGDKYAELEASTHQVIAAIEAGTIAKGSRIGYLTLEGHPGIAEVLDVHQLIVFALPLGPELLLAKIKKDPVLMFERKKGHSSLGGRMVTEEFARQKNAPEVLPEFVIRDIRKRILEGE